MTRTRSLVWTGASLATLYAASTAIVLSGLVAREPAVGLGVALDLTVTSAGLVWLLAVRRGALPRWTVAVVIAAGALAAKAVLPVRSLIVLPAVWGAVELGLAIAAVRNPRVRALFASEIEALRYGLGGWFRREPQLAAGEFTLGRTRPWATLMGVLAFMVVVETGVLHVALAHWSPVAAWIASALSAYGLIWLAGDYHAWRLHPLRVARGELHARLGLRWRLRVPVAHIARVERVDSTPADALKMSVMGANVVLDFDRKVTVNGPFGLAREVRRVALTVDDVDGFQASIVV